MENGRGILRVRILVGNLRGGWLRLGNGGYELHFPRYVVQETVTKINETNSSEFGYLLRFGWTCIADRT
jgi:hypothetical protein